MEFTRGRQFIKPSSIGRYHRDEEEKVANNRPLLRRVIDPFSKRPVVDNFQEALATSEQLDSSLTHRFGGRGPKMCRKRWIAPWAESPTRASIYHIASRVVDRRFIFKDVERENFRMFMRMYENFSGCRVLSYCIMSNHFHLLLEVPPMPAEGISDEELLKRLGTIHTEAAVAGVAQELKKARAGGSETEVAEIHARYTYRMHDLSEFMKTLLQRKRPKIHPLSNSC